jgi:hypothetical protein
VREVLVITVVKESLGDDAHEQTMEGLDGLRAALKEHIFTDCDVTIDYRLERGND